VELAGHVGRLRRVIGPLYPMVSGKAEGMTLWVVDSIEAWVVGVQLRIYVPYAVGMHLYAKTIHHLCHGLAKSRVIISK